MVTYIIKQRQGWMTDDMAGWGNGYIVISKGHPLYGLNDYELPSNIHSLFYGGCTFSGRVSGILGEDSSDERWCLGFDTSHAGDNIKTWPKTAVDNACRKLVYKINSLYPIRDKKLDLI